eukprot:c22959_g5_i1 orf=71-2851(+)
MYASEHPFISECHIRNLFSVDLVNRVTPQNSSSRQAGVSVQRRPFSAQSGLISNSLSVHGYDCSPPFAQQISPLSTQGKAQKEEGDVAAAMAIREAVQCFPRHNPMFKHKIQQPNEVNESGHGATFDDRLQSLCEQGHLDMAIEVLFDMSSSPPSTSSYLSLLNACIKSRSLTHVKSVKAHITLHKVALRGMLGDYLVMALARCGALEDACHVSDSLPHLTVFSWTAIISAYAEQGFGQEALQLHRLMLDQGVDPDRYTFVGLFRACGCIPDLMVGRKLHAEACKKGVTLDLFVSNSLVTMYGKHGAILDAEGSFQAMPHRDVVSWNAMLSVYVEQDHEERALQLYRQMQEEGLDSNQQTFVIALQACVILAEKEEALLAEGMPVKVKALRIGEALHADVRSKGFMLDLYVGTALSTMYGKCGAIAQAENLFSVLPQRSIISWNSMLSACLEQRQGGKTLHLYRQLQEEGVIMDELTVVFALQACGILVENEKALHETMNKRASLQVGQALHADICAKGFESDVFVGTALLGMYSKCESILDAENVFSELSERNMVSWSAMLTAYMDQGLGQKALHLYRQMQEEGMSSNTQAVVLAIQACGTLADNKEVSSDENHSTKLIALEIGHALHADACKSGSTSNVLISTALVSMYGKCGSIMEAESVFRSLTQLDAVTYTAILSAYINEGHAEEAIHLYKEMPKQHLVLDDVTLICLLQACGETGSLELCEELYFVIVSAGYDRVGSVISALVHTYGNCASMVDGQAAFDGLCEPDIKPWTACITGHAGEGNVAASLHMLELLNLSGLMPDEITLSSALLACGHTGNIVKAFEYFNSMSGDHGIVPDLKHYGIMVELLGRAGDFERMKHMLVGMPMEADAAIWLCMLGACCVHGNAGLAKEAFNRTLNLQPNQASAYILMSNAYVDFVLP